jgi:hypothetical protein
LLKQSICSHEKSSLCLEQKCYCCIAIVAETDIEERKQFLRKLDIRRK